MYRGCTEDDLRLVHCSGCLQQFDHAVDRDNHQVNCHAAKNAVVDEITAFHEYLDDDAAVRRAGGVTSIADRPVV